MFKAFDSGCARCLAFLAMAFGLWCASPGYSYADGRAQVDGNWAANMDSSKGKVTLTATEVHDMRSVHSGHDYRIYVALPEIPPGTARQSFSVAYVLDANGFFGMVTEIARNLQAAKEIPPLIIVGIGYPVETFSDTVTSRLRDFTPTPDAVHEELVAHLVGGAVPVRSGEAANFLRFIEDELKPFIATKYPANAKDSLLVGDSLGGLFGLYTLLHRPQTFARYIIGSPPLLWDNETILKQEAGYAQTHRDLAARVFMSVGALEDDITRVLNLPPNMRDAEQAFLDKIGHVNPLEQFKQFTATLTGRAYPSLDLTVTVFDNETHASVPAVTFSQGLRAVYANPK